MDNGVRDVNGEIWRAGTPFENLPEKNFGVL
jgi:hypothetical protein